MVRLSLMSLWVMVLVAENFACSSRSLTDPRRSIDASTGPIDTSTGPIDASTEAGEAGNDAEPACNCQIDSDGVMTMSWSCFEKYFGAGNPWIGWCGAAGQWTSGCGLDLFSFYDQYGLLQQYVYDGSVQVGARYENQYTPFTCPDSTLYSLTIASGDFPGSTCSMTNCGCYAGGTVLLCPTPPQGDAAVPTDAGYTPFDAGACDCQITDGVLTMSLACFCSRYGCEQPELGWCGGDGQWTSSCGIDVYTVIRNGLPQSFAYDRAGVQVGVRYENSSTNYVCPVDSTLQAMKVAGGVFPASTCATTNCGCDRTANGSYPGTFACPALDAGLHSDSSVDR